MKSGDIISALIRALYEVRIQGSLAKETALELLAVIIASVGIQTPTSITPSAATLRAAEEVVIPPSRWKDTQTEPIPATAKVQVKQIQSKYAFEVKSGCGRLYRTLKGAKQYHHQYCKAKGSGCSLETTDSSIKEYPYRADIVGWLKDKDTPNPNGLRYTAVEVELGR